MSVSLNQLRPLNLARIGPDHLLKNPHQAPAILQKQFGLTTDYSCQQHGRREDLTRSLMLRWRQ